jgi:hypothetical protein
MPNDQCITTAENLDEHLLEATVHLSTDPPDKCLISTASQVDTGRRGQDFFLEIMEANGIPSHVQGDCGTENLYITRYMEELSAVGRGSFIWCRYYLSL